MRLLNHIRPALAMLGLFSLLTGILYPLAVTVLSQTIFPEKAGGSLIVEGGKVVGSALVGQNFSSDRYFWPRRSAIQYNAATSGGSNQGPLHESLAVQAARRAAELCASDPLQRRPASLPADLLTASGSGLDPHISPEAARWQLPRVAAARGVPEDEINRLILKNTEGRFLGFWGEPRVNVLLLNLDLDRRRP